MAPIDKAIAFLRSSNKPNISEAARRFGVERSVLSKHFRGKRVSIAKAN
jgi:transposase-like protein